MDISQINDINELKSLAYDQIAARDVAQQNLNTLNERINYLSQLPPTLPPAEEGELVEGPNHG